MLGGRTPARADPAWARRRRLQLLFAVACFGSLASALPMVCAAPNGYTSRAYYGTDTRAQALLVGAALAVGLTLWRERAGRPWFTRAASVLASPVLWNGRAVGHDVADLDVRLQRRVMLASLAAGGVVLGCAVAPRCAVVRLLELPPLPQLGRISYGIYLWYWPVVLIMSGQRLDWSPYPLFVARVAVTVAIAALSYEVVEMPVRRGALRRWRSWVAAPVGAAVAISMVSVSMLVPVGAAELQGTQLTVSAPSSVKTSPGTATLAGSLSSVPFAPGSPATAPTTTTTTTLPPFLSPAVPAVPAVPAATSSKPVKVLLVGDSVAGSLGVGLAAEAQPYDVQVVNEGAPACSVSMQGQLRVLWYTVTPTAPCDVGGNPNSLFDTWRAWVNVYNPDVVVYLARGETFDQEVGGQWQNIGQPGFDSYLANRYRQAVSVLGSKGASVVLLTTPYYDSGTSPAGTPWPEDAPARATADNATIREVASTTPSGSEGSRVYVFDLNALISPAGAFSPTVDQVNVRCTDGVHFTRSGGIYVGERLAPEMAALGQAHAAASPGGAWAGPLPPSTPSWFSKLPCQ